MLIVQPITLDDAVVGLVVGDDHAVISQRLSGPELRLVQGMCLFAMEVASGTHAGPYSDRVAHAYAERLVRPAAASTPGP